MKNPLSYRLGLLDYARRQGITAAARGFQTTVPTVRKGLRRYQAEGPKGLVERSRTPHHCPHQVRGERERQVGISEHTFDRWKKPYRGLAVNRVWQLTLLHREGWKAGRYPVYRQYREEGSVLGQRHRRRRRAAEHLARGGGTRRLAEHEVSKHQELISRTQPCRKSPHRIPLQKAV